MTEYSEFEKEWISGGVLGCSSGVGEESFDADSFGKAPLDLFPPDTTETMFVQHPAKTSTSGTRSSSNRVSDSSEPWSSPDNFPDSMAEPFSPVSLGSPSLTAGRHWELCLSPRNGSSVDTMDTMLLSWASPATTAQVDPLDRCLDFCEPHDPLSLFRLDSFVCPSLTSQLPHMPQARSVDSAEAGPLDFARLPSFSLTRSGNGTGDLPPHADADPASRGTLKSFDVTDSVPDFGRAAQSDEHQPDADFQSMSAPGLVDAVSAVVDDAGRPDMHRGSPSPSFAGYQDQQAKAEKSGSAALPSLTRTSAQVRARTPRQPSASATRGGKRAAKALKSTKSSKGKTKPRAAAVTASPSDSNFEYAAPVVSGSSRRQPTPASATVPTATAAAAAVAARASARLREDEAVWKRELAPKSRPLVYSREERALKIKRWLTKRARLPPVVRTGWQCRKQYAQGRPRIGGKFIALKGTAGEEAHQAWLAKQEEPEWLIASRVQQQQQTPSAARAQAMED